MNATLLTTAPAVLLGAAILTAQNALAPARPAPVWESCEELHDDFTNRFESSRGFGLNRMWMPPMLDRAGVVDMGQRRYSLETVELVGLLQRPTPVVYVPDLHTSARDSKTAESRPLSGFEKDSLEAFRAGKGIASVPERSGGMRCMGAVRAKDTCLRCHTDKKAGDLLGAFTYGLRPLPPR